MKENLVILMGQMIGKPQARGKRNEFGQTEITEIAINLNVIRRSGTQIDPTLQVKSRVDTPLIVSRDEKIINKILTFKEGDMVIVKGTISTLNIPKKRKCPHCESEYTWQGQKSYITPMFIEVIKEGLTREQGKGMLRKWNEMSNMIYVAAYLVKDPEYFRKDGDKGPRVLQCRVAINRHYRIKDDPVDKVTDYPIVKFFGNEADKQKEALHQGSLIYIAGAIQTYLRPRTYHCPDCGEEEVGEEICTEIIPSRVEWIDNCNKPEVETSEEDVKQEKKTKKTTKEAKKTTKKTATKTTKKTLKKEKE